jgi:hypothetical protein
MFPDGLPSEIRNRILPAGVKVPASLEHLRSRAQRAKEIFAEIELEEENARLKTVIEILMETRN